MRSLCITAANLCPLDNWPGMWIDTHCHLDAAEWTDGERLAARCTARQAGVALCVYPAVSRRNWSTVRALAHQTSDAYALGIHPLYVQDASDSDLQALDETLQQHCNDPRLVAVGEIGLDFFVPALREPEAAQRQRHFYQAQLRLAQKHGLPVLLHVRRSADALLQGLRAMARQGRPVPGGLAHAFNGSEQQAQAFAGLGFGLGFGGAVTFDAARQLRRLATGLPLEHLVLETDAPDMPPQWLYVTAQARAQGQAPARNAPGELPRIGACVAGLRGLPGPALARATTANAIRCLPKLQALLGNNSEGAA